MSEVRYLNVPEALMIYAEIVRASRVEVADVQNPGGLESALAQPQQTFDQKDLYATLEEKAASLLYSLCQNHPFVDGNKRMAFLATRTFLRLNGLDLDVEIFEVKDFMEAIAKGDVSVDKAASWVRQRACRYEALSDIP